MLAGLATGATAQTVGTVQFASDTLIYPESPGNGSSAILQTGVTIWTISGTISGSPTINLNPTDGTAIKGTDYALGVSSARPADSFVSYELNFYTPSNSGVWTYPNSNDEPDKTFTLTMSKQGPDDPRYNLGSRTTTTVVIRDNDPTIVSLARMGTGAVTEGGTVEFTVTLGRALVAGEVIDVPLSISGTGVTTGDWSLDRKSGTANTGVSLRDTGTSTPKVRFSGTGARTATLELTATADGVSESAETFTIALGSNANFDAAALGTNVGGGADPHGTTNSFSVTVNDGGGSSVSITGTSVVTEGGTASFTVSASPAPAAGLTVNLRVQQTGDFVAAGDLGRKTVTIPGGMSSATYTVQTVNDNVDEANGQVRVQVLAGDGYAPGSPAFHDAIVTDNDNAAVSFSAASYRVSEGEAVSVTLNIVQPRSTTTAVGISCTDGTADSADYSGCPSSVTIPANAASHSFTVQTATDSTNEADETFTVSIASVPAGVATGSPSTATVVIFDNGVVPCDNCVWITAGTSPVTEGGNAVFTVHAYPPPTADVSVGLVVSDVQGRSLSDFVLGRHEGYKTVTIPSGHASADYTVPTKNDEKDELDGAVTVSLQGFPTAGGRLYRIPGVRFFPYYRKDGPRSASVTVRDNDADLPPHVAPTISVSTLWGAARPSRVVTEGETAYFCFSIDGSTGTDGGTYPANHPDRFQVAYAVTSTSGRPLHFAVPELASDPEGSQRAREHSLTRDARYGALQLSGRTRLMCLDFYTDGEGGETLTARVRPGGKIYYRGRNIASYRAGSASTATVTVLPRPQGGEAFDTLQGGATPLPVVTISADADTVTEGGDVIFTVSADPVPSYDLPVNVGVAQEMGATGDRVAEARFDTVTIRAGRSSAAWTVTTLSDDVARADGEAVGRVLSGYDYRLGARTKVAVALIDDDGGTADTDDAPEPTSVTTQPEPQGVTIALVAEVKGHIAHFKARNHGAGVRDWTLVLDRLEGRTGMSDADIAAWLARSRQYGWQDGIQTLPKVQAALAALAAVPDPQQQPATMPVVTIAADAASVTEGGTAAFTLTAAPPPPADLTVSVTVATTGDYGIAGASRTVTIPPAGSFTLTLATTGDTADEPDGSVTVTVADGAGYTVGSSASGTVAVRDDDEPLPVVTVAAGDAVTEGGDAVFTLTASPLPASPLAVSVTVAASGDYGIAGASRTVTIPPAGSGTLTLATADDAADEPDGSVTVTVNDGAGYTVGSSASGTVSVQDDDLPPPAVSITAAAASVTEGGTASFTVSADRAPDADLTITLSVTEAAGGDHVAADDEGTATVTIAKGATEAAFPVATVDDAVDEPDGSVTVTVAAGAGYTVSSSRGAATVSVSDDDAAATGPVLSVDDATERESGQRYGNSLMEFTVRLSAAAAQTVRVRASTRVSSPVSARPKEDYWPLRPELVKFYPGQTSKQVYILIFNDSHDEDPETFEVVLSDADGATIGDGVAVGTIVNDDPMPAAWLARFGRTVAEQALDGIAGRMAAPRTAGMQGTLAGQALSFHAPASGNRTAAGSPAPGGTGSLALADVARRFDNRADRFGNGGFGNAPGSLSPGSVSGAGGAGLTQSRTMTARDALLGSSFSLTGATDGSGGSMAFWGRAAQGSFDGREGTFSLDGAVTTGMLGADYARGKWLVGLALAQSEGEGDYRDSDVSPRPEGQTCPADAEDSDPCNGAVRAGDGSVEASLTAAIPYAALQASERLKLWGAAGYGTGEVTLKTAMGGSYKADTSWSMAAAGLRGDLLEAPEEGSGPALALTSDALWTRTSSEKTRDLAASDSDATRLRLGLEGSYRMALEDGGHVTPRLEVGARHDGGDAETGFGVEIGGGVAWVDPGLGLSLDVSGRTLIAHGNDDLKDRGYAASLAFDPDPATQRGPSLSLRQDWGSRATGGLDALFQPATLEDRTGSEATSRWTMEAAYGFPAFGGRFTGSPHAGLGLATAARDYSLGWRLTPEGQTAANVSFGLKATRRESGTAQPEHTIGFEINARW